MQTRKSEKPAMSHLVLETESVAQSPDGDPAVDPRTAMPGPLAGTVTLTLHTAHAQRLVIGRWATAEHDGLLGLFAFADLLRTIWHGAAAADPYADWWLLKVERALTRAQRELQALTESVTAELADVEALSIAPAASARPVVTALRFATPQAFRGAHIVGRYDALARAALAARHTGCLSSQLAAKTLWAAGQVVRRTFDVARAYVATGITRADLIHCTPRAAVAVQRMGVLPAAILNGTRTPQHVPARERTSLIETPVTAPAQPSAERVETVALAGDELNGRSLTFEDDLP